MKIGSNIADGIARDTRSISSLKERITSLKSRLRVAVIFGGDKSAPGSVLYHTDNTRHWKSYQTVAEDIATSLRRLGFQHVELLPDDMTMAERLRHSNIHIAWLNSGGVQGLSSMAHAACILEMLGVPYVGHDPLSVTILDNKHLFKREALFAGLPTPQFATWHMARGPFSPERSLQFLEAFGNYPGPFIVKPVSGRASHHVHCVGDVRGLPEAVAAVYGATRNTVLIEKYLSGREFCIGVMGNVTARDGQLRRRDRPFTFSALERVFGPEEMIFTSMDARPITAQRFKPIDPNKDPELHARLHALAEKVFVEFNLSSLVRIDIRADEDGDLYILETNPKPDLARPCESVTSLLCAGLPGVGMSYEDLILSLFADRLGALLQGRPTAVRHIFELIENEGKHGTACQSKDDAEYSASAAVTALDATLAAVQNVDVGGFSSAAAEVRALGEQGAGFGNNPPAVDGNETPVVSTRINLRTG
jgi:D-alanine-D-alanine ligase